MTDIQVISLSISLFCLVIALVVEIETKLAYEEVLNDDPDNTWD